MVTAGNRNDCTQAETVIARICVASGGPGRPRVRPEHVVADKGCSARTKPSTDGATSSNAASTASNKRGIATRYEKHPARYHATITLASTLIWLTE